MKETAEEKGKGKGNKSTKVKVWPTAEISRSDIKNAPYNPRTITEKARKKLKENLLKNGLMGGIVWNRRTGNLVSGHQRLSIIDSINKGQDYKINVTVVDFDLETEKKQNIALNNKEMQGDYDMDKLRDMLADMPDITDTGFSETDTLQMFGEGLNYSSEEYQKACEQAEKAREIFDIANRLQATKADNFYSVIVWKEATQRATFLKLLGLKDNKFVAASDFVNAIKTAVLDGKL